ncbi:MAG: histidinol-phosphatase [Lachnospiraceae bacterium]|nr:histidinol-phosphatase [Lachnospiraceae bacterium]
MKANYHTHTWRCMHAVGTEREYVESAIEGGLKVLGFSDHTPCPYPKEYVSGMRMRTDQLEDYVDTVLALKEEYRQDIEIHLGLEVEYYTDYFAGLRRMVSDYPVEYFLLGQHCIGCEIGGEWSGCPTDDPKALQDYCAQTSEAMETGYFTYFAHPDLIRFTGDERIYQEEMRRLCRKAKSLQIPLEINLLGIYEERHYPDERFWKIAGEEGCKVLFGTDAHNPEALNCPRVLQAAENIVRRHGLQVQETVEFRAPL